MSDNQVQAAEEPAESLLSFDEAVRFLDTSKSTLYRLLSQEDIKGVKVGKQWRFRKADLTAYIERSPAAIAVNAVALADLRPELAFFDGELEAIGRPLEPSDPNDSIAGESDVAALTHRIFLLAVGLNASDVHVEAGSSGLRLRYRIDGAMQDIRNLPPSLQEAIVAQFKETFDMNLIEKRLPQDGRMPQFRAEGKEFDLRASLLPTMFGESIVIRLLDQSSVSFGLSQLASRPGELDGLMQRLHRPGGLILVTGPSGSGKTTLLYSCLKEVATEDKKALAVEDPVECALPNVTQVRVNLRSGVTFPVALRSLLRSDPDIILCGEIRDRETAELLLSGSLTGILTLSALHADSAIGAIVRLVDMGIEPFLIGAGLNSIVATRLVRRLCPECKTMANGDSTHSLKMRLRRFSGEEGCVLPQDAVLYTAAGCDRCRRTGYCGRFGLFEILDCSPKLVHQLIKLPSELEMTQLAIASGMRTLLADGVRKALDGETSIQEVLRVTGHIP